MHRSAVVALVKGPRWGDGMAGRVGPGGHLTAVLLFSFVAGRAPPNIHLPVCLVDAKGRR